MGRMYGWRSPVRPIASCTLAVPNAPSLAAISLSARRMLRYTTPISYMSASFRFQRCVEARIDAPRVAFVDLAARPGLDRSRVDVAPGVVVMVAGGRVDAAHRADHLAREQDVVDRNDAGEQVDPRLVVDAGVEEHVVQQVLLQERLLQLLREPAETAPVVRHRAAAVRDHEP